MKYNDIYTETPAHADTLANLGPLAPLAGKWYGEDGVDTHPEAEGPVAEPYHETWTFEVIDAQNNGPQVFYGLRYHVYITKPGELNAFHDQVGYLLWEPETKKIYMTLAIPRGQIAMAEGTAEPGAKTITLRAERGNLVNGICSNPFLEEAFNTKSWEIQFRFNPDGTFDYDAIREKINGRTKLITIQRSKGYATRPSYSVEEIGRLIAFCKECKPDVLCMVDNCYGEFVETIEPSDLGADMVVGSLIKNPGGGLAPIGGYICGTKECVDRCAYRLSAPGLGQEVGANLGLMPALYQGLFLSPTVVSGALKGAVFAANIYEKLGFACVPNATESRHDIIQAVTLGSAEAMVAFCKGIQAAAPVDSYVTPEPWAMPGYDSDVIMAAGAFVQGSSIELSADGPIRPPYAVYFQGGLTWYHAKLGILMSLQKLVEAGLVTLPESK